MLGDRLRALRMRHRWTQEDLAKKLNVAVSTVSGYESGNRKPDIETLLRVAEIFNISLDHLLDRKTEQIIDLNDHEMLKKIILQLDNQPLSDEDTRYLLAIIREKRNLNRFYEQVHNQKTSRSTPE